MAQNVPLPLAALRREGYLFSNSSKPFNITAPVLFESSTKFRCFMTLTTCSPMSNDKIGFSYYLTLSQKCLSNDESILRKKLCITSDNNKSLCESPTQVF